MEKLDCVGHVQKRMGKHLLNLEARTKGKLVDGQPIGGRGCKSLMLLQFAKTQLKSQTQQKERWMRVYAMKKNIIATLHHSVKSQDPAKQHRFCPPVTIRKG